VNVVKFHSFKVNRHFGCEVGFQDRAKIVFSEWENANRDYLSQYLPCNRGSYLLVVPSKLNNPLAFDPNQQPMAWLDIPSLTHAPNPSKPAPYDDHEERNNKDNNRNKINRPEERGKATAPPDKQKGRENGR